MPSNLVRLATSLPKYSKTTQSEGTIDGVMSPYLRSISKAVALSNDHEPDLTPLLEI